MLGLDEKCRDWTPWDCRPDGWRLRGAGDAPQDWQTIATVFDSWVTVCLGAASLVVVRERYIGIRKNVL